MNINAVNNINTMNFKNRTKKFVQIVEEKRSLGDYTLDYVLPEIKKITSMAKQYNNPVNVAQLENNKLLANFGMITKVIDLKDIPVNQVESVFRNIIRGNAIAEKQGLQKGMEYIESNMPVSGSKLIVSV